MSPIQSALSYCWCQTPVRASHSPPSAPSTWEVILSSLSRCLNPSQEQATFILVVLSASESEGLLMADARISIGKLVVLMPTSHNPWQVRKVLCRHISPLDQDHQSMQVFRPLLRLSLTATYHPNVAAAYRVNK